VFDQDRYFDVFVKYAKATPEDILIQTICNMAPIFLHGTSNSLCPVMYSRESTGCLERSIRHSDSKTINDERPPVPHPRTRIDTVVPPSAKNQEDVIP
jgi:hypothetical protein